MALGDSYATPADLEIHLGRTDPGNFTTLLDQASRRVERFTRRQFNKTDTATERRFRPTDPYRLPVDDFWTNSGLIVEVNGTALDLDDVDLYPYDGVYEGQPGWPFYVLYRTSGTWPFSRSTVITVTAKWGWDSVPAGIFQATLECAAVGSYGESGSYPVRQVSIQDYSESYALPDSAGDVPAELKAAEPYRRKRWGIA